MSLKRLGIPIPCRNWKKIYGTLTDLKGYISIPTDLEETISKFVDPYKWIMLPDTKEAMLQSSTLTVPDSGSTVGQKFETSFWSELERRASREVCLRLFAIRCPSAMTLLEFQMEYQEAQKDRLTCC